MDNEFNFWKKFIQLLMKWMMEQNNNVSGNGQNRRRAGMWITDAIYMSDAHKLVLTIN